ncbi:WYL domain-containing protein [Pectobacterium carotovorum]|uniref:WYL domain-containing protein n=1 Tax=Pectobacterium versatile TaxID=2488639 RepID=A0ABU8K5W4_9GAMM|nr:MULTISPECIES: hypothetical protein [Pectobacterium]MBQ4781272.1 hypothetical protein [Pectobacterium versatile]MBQ4785829.1 hypothetical protein [Pectobacterium versatile]MBQ4791698.1 hypothetical protein [Pectobacterium versatile]MCL6366029.1 hypothetical protein [Pectobacterium carotovorum subsp. carotovorum]QLL92407.1 WYL domain-containing protein [Pectobacterium carotovorum]
MDVIISIIGAILSFYIVRYSYSGRYSDKIVKISSVCYSFSFFIISLISLIFNDYPILYFFCFLNVCLLIAGYSYREKAANKNKNESGEVSTKSGKFRVFSSKVNLKEIAFEYEDSVGKQSYRTIDVKECDLIYITGYCHTAKALRTFRVDRIIDGVIIRETGEILDSYEYVNQYKKSRR